MVPTAQASVAERAATACKAPPGAAAAGPRTHLQLVPSHRSIRAPRPVVPTAQALDAVAGTTPVKRNRFVQLSGGTRSVNRALEAKARALAGLKGYVTNLQACPDGTPITAEFVIGAYHRLSGIQKAFRMSKHDCKPGRFTTASATPSKRT
jgi:hypothetical protein